MTRSLSVRQDLFSGTVRRIAGINRIEATIDLPFDIAITRPIVLEDVRVKDFPSDDLLRDRAQHCLIVLLGGKNIVVVPSSYEVDRWRSKPTTLARVYLNERIFGEPVGFTPKMPGYDKPLLEVSSFYTWLRAQDFRVSEVKNVINGVRRGRSA